MFGQDTLLCISLSSHVGLGLSVSNFCTARLVCRSFNQYNSVLSYPSTSSSSSSLSRRQLILLDMILSFSQKKRGRNKEKMRAKAEQQAKHKESEKHNEKQGRGKNDAMRGAVRCDAV